MRTHTSAHLFTGGCGDVRGFANAGFRPVFGANHHPASVATAKANWPDMATREADIQSIDMRTVPRATVLVGSPICWESTPSGGNSKARTQDTLDYEQPGDKPRGWTQTRITAWEPIRYTEVHRPLAYVGENVPGFATTNRALFDAWLHVWDAIGYVPVLACVNAAHIRVGDLGPLPQYRDRLVWAMIRKDLGRLPDLRPRPSAMCPACGPVLGVQHWTNLRGRQVGAYNPRATLNSTGTSYFYVCPTERCHQKVEPIVPGIGDVIDPTVRGHRFGDGRPDRKHTPYKPGTRSRVQAGVEQFHGKPFIVTLRRNGRATSLDVPIGTLTAQGGGHHYLARPTPDLDVDEVEYRPLTVEEKAAAQGFPSHHILKGDAPDQRLQVGNAVPVNVATWVATKVMEVLPA
ncbi:DNA cytosine methyltransferase [Streptomyces albidoflavus]|uniref:DNA cytosine methyltransferase n=1 Tax=Streptomyces albidoflavus TaxID=1886 RepID=UPI00101F5C6C|nr:DNA cytosine methyltransferase [Streptomyces albidoflavus]RZF02811.1 DNA cytosine methyltransferase [Streptomyces albidoflavus]